MPNLRSTHLFPLWQNQSKIADIVKKSRQKFVSRSLDRQYHYSGRSRLLINISNCLDYYEQITEHSLSNRIRYCLYFSYQLSGRTSNPKRTDYYLRQFRIFLFKLNRRLYKILNHRSANWKLPMALIFPMLKLNIYPIFCWKAIRSLCTFQRLPSKRKERRRNFPAASHT